MRGGYKILNLGGFNFTPDSGQVITGSYELLESSPKATLVSGLVVEGKEVPETFAPCSLAESAYTLTVPGYLIKVESGDTVTVSASSMMNMVSVGPSVLKSKQK